VGAFGGVWVVGVCLGGWCWGGVRGGEGAWGLTDGAGVGVWQGGRVSSPTYTEMGVFGGGAGLLGVGGTKWVGGWVGRLGFFPSRP